LASATVLFTIGRGVSYPAFLGLTLLSGACGGIAMTMGRTLVQENAPEALRSRVMSIYTLSVLGGTPLGNLLMGHLAAQVGVLAGITIAAIAMAVTTLTVRAFASFDG
jgi:MFS family permease